MTIVNTSGGDFYLDLSQDKLVDDFYKHLIGQADGFLMVAIIVQVSMIMRLFQ